MRGSHYENVSALSRLPLPRFHFRQSEGKISTLVRNGEQDIGEVTLTTSVIAEEIPQPNADSIVNRSKRGVYLVYECDTHGY